jgi:hypothetical protein
MRRFAIVGSLEGNRSSIGFFDDRQSSLPVVVE